MHQATDRPNVNRLCHHFGQRLFRSKEFLAQDSFGLFNVFRKSAKPEVNKLDVAAFGNDDWRGTNSSMNDALDMTMVNRSRKFLNVYANILLRNTLSMVELF